MTNKSRYISCMKLNNRPMLPPLMTEERREECRKLRAKAVECERRLERNQIISKCTHELEELSKRMEDIQMRSRTSLESQLAQEMPSARTPMLTRETFDVTEYSTTDGIKLIDRKPSPPKLIRSNSYTLDTPSPILLAHLEQEARKSLTNADSLDSDDYVTETDITIRSITISTSKNDDTELGDLIQNLPEDTAKTVMEMLVDKPLPRDSDLEKRNWAASKIGAWARGYLVRRLMKTERVQGLIDTIRDALLCAIELHAADVIEEADVELHRRLIQQVSAACFAFHDVFFLLSTKERMDVIASDRIKRLDRMRKSREMLTHIVQMDDSKTAR